ncbi:hypothetical protein [Undibacterium sp. TC9W]|uniref:hypothetical protein n=1 Tax=Undibacterium sp. TC9W TaxID=3413053 RepID=UPI003BF14D18
MRSRLFQLAVPILLLSACQASTEISAYLLPGASQELVASSLKLSKCDPQKVSKDISYCDVKEAEFGGAPASFRLSLQNGKLINTTITLPADEFSATVSSMTKRMGESSYEREFEVYGVKHKSIHWGSKDLYATANRYAFGDTKHSMLILMLPEATPEIARPLFLKNDAKPSSNAARQ